MCRSTTLSVVFITLTVEHGFVEKQLVPGIQVSSNKHFERSNLARADSLAIPQPFAQVDKSGLLMTFETRVVIHVSTKQRT